MKKDDFLKGAFVATVCLIITKILGALYVIPFYAIVGSKGTILYGSAYNIYAIFLNLSTLGLPLAISKMVSEYQTLDYQSVKKRAYKIAGRLMIVMSLLTTVILFLAAPFLAQNIIKTNIDINSYAPLGAFSFAFSELIETKMMIEGITTVMRVSALAIVFVTLLSMMRGYLQGMKYITASSISQVIEQIIRVIIIVLGSYLCVKVFNTTITTAIVWTIIGAIIGAIVAFIYLLYKKSQVPEVSNYEIKEEEKKITNKDILKKVATYTVPLIIMELIGMSFQLVDMFTVVRTLTAHGFSVTDASNIMNIVTTLGIKLNVIVMTIANGIVISLLPNLTSDFVSGNIEAVRSKITRTIEVICYITIPMAIGLSFLAEPAWTVFYGPDFYGPRVFCVSVFVAVFGSIFTNVMIMMQSLNRYKKMYLALFIGFGFNAIMNIPFMVFFGEIGLKMYYGNLIATMIGYGLAITICLIDLKKAFHIHYGKTLKYLAYTILTSLFMVAMLSVLKTVVPISNPSRLISLLIAILYAGIGAIIYFAITYKLKMYDDIIGIKLKLKRK